MTSYGDRPNDHESVSKCESFLSFVLLIGSYFLHSLSSSSYLDPSFFLFRGRCSPLLSSVDTFRFGGNHDLTLSSYSPATLPFPPSLSSLPLLFCLQDPCSSTRLARFFFLFSSCVLSDFCIFQHFSSISSNNSSTSCDTLVSLPTLTDVVFTHRFQKQIPRTQPIVHA